MKMGPAKSHLGVAVAQNETARVTQVLVHVSTLLGVYVGTVFLSHSHLFKKAMFTFQ